MAVDLGSVLDLSGELQRAASLSDVVIAAQAAVARTSRYRTTWLGAVEETPDGTWIRILAMEGVSKEIIWERAPRFPVRDDPFLLEILAGDHPVIVEDMRTDPRTDKEIVSRTDHRTGITVPMRFGKATLGILCVGTFGAEGVVPPTRDEVENFTVITSLVASAFERVRLLALKNASDEEMRALVEKGRALENQLRHFQRLEAVGELAGGIAHDFNNLLTVISGHASLALAEDPAASVAESLRVIVQATERGAHLTHNLLSFSRKRVLTRRVSDLNEVIAHAHALVRPAVSTEIEVTLVRAPSAVVVSVDEVELEHAIINLVTNARDAIEGPGTIRIEVKTMQVDDELIARHAGKLAGESAVVSVVDSGGGMDAATLERVFEPFFTTKAVGRGSGLGLATVRSIVDQHGGLVVAESLPGQGTTFAIMLPLATVPWQRASGLAVPEVIAGGRGETILLAEDDDMVREMLAKVLRGQGYRVIEAIDGQAAIDAFRAESAHIALVLTDLMMPRRSGLELVDAVLAFRQGTPIVVMSGYTSDPAGASRLGALGLRILNKPTSPSQVLTAIRQTIDAARPGE
ncbi:MAG: response regulator [Polyangiaceae bacterium]|nr:response regulator [Polyangiaceae bacterium]